MTAENAEGLDDGSGVAVGFNEAAADDRGKRPWSRWPTPSPPSLQ